MNIPCEYTGLHLAKEYIDDRKRFEESRRLLKQINHMRPSRVYCAFCRSLVSIGHVLVSFGKRLERYDLILRQT